MRRVAAPLRNAFDADAREPGLPSGALPGGLPLAGRGFWLQALRRFQSFSTMQALSTPSSSAMRRLLIASVLLLSLAAQAQVKVDDPWVRATVAPQKATGAFMQLTSARPAKVVAASSPVAAMVEIHEMKMDDGVMKMRAVDALALPAGQPVALKPGSYHVMLMGLKQPIKAGDTVPLTLTVEGEDGRRAGVEVKAVAR